MEVFRFKQVGYWPVQCASDTAYTLETTDSLDAYVNDVRFYQVPNLWK